ncbi:acyltransferase family protein [Erythrobacter sp. 3-20A1M]|nr:acyltransferase family protein [Erythrobacter sp. 3-20A1M]
MRHVVTGPLSLPHGLAIGPGTFRVILAAFVVASHLSNFEIGRPAVFVFFSLSGYWISAIYDRRYSKYPTLWIFYLSRFLRIWLSFAAAFVLALGVFALVGEPRPPITLAGLALFGIASNRLDVLGTAWSLDLEMQFYLLFPLLWLLGARIRSRAVIAAGVIAVTAFGWFLREGPGLWTALAYAPSFVLGMAIYATRWAPSRGLVLAGLLAFGAVGVLVFLSPTLSALLIKSDPGPIDEDIFGQLWVVFLLPFVAWNVRQQSGPIDRTLGNFSYPLYIIHWPVVALLLPSLAAYGLAGKVVVLGAILMVAIAFYVLVDRPAESLRTRLLGAALEKVGWQPEHASRAVRGPPLGIDRDGAP